VLDKNFFAVMGSLGAAESLRFSSRKMILEREYAAGAPWVTSVPSNRHVVAKDLALYSSEFLVAYELKKSQLLAARGRHQPQTLVGISSRHDGDSLEERGWEHSYPRARGLHSS
jgi:hypothetical protein